MRKKPVRHTVKEHTRNGRRVKSHVRGTGAQRRKTLTLKKKSSALDVKTQKHNFRFVLFNEHDGYHVKYSSASTPEELVKSLKLWPTFEKLAAFDEEIRDYPPASITATTRDGKVTSLKSVPPEYYNAALKQLESKGTRIGIWAERRLEKKKEWLKQRTR